MPGEAAITTSSRKGRRDVDLSSPERARVPPRSACVHDLAFTSRSRPQNDPPHQSGHLSRTGSPRLGRATHDQRRCTSASAQSVTKTVGWTEGRRHDRHSSDGMSRRRTRREPLGFDTARSSWPCTPRLSDAIRDPSWKPYPTPASGRRMTIADHDREFDRLARQ